MPIKKERIEYIDLAKGFCILLVVFAHIHPDLTRYSWGVFFDSFRMPLYFFLSGIFFKKYSGIQEFGVKKINNLIIPLLFFYAFTYLYDAASWGIGRLTDGDTTAYERLSWWPFWEILRTGSTDLKQQERFYIRDILRRDFCPALGIDADLSVVIQAALRQNFVPVVDDRNALCGIVTRQKLIAAMAQQLESE